jgi:Tfp pilus assembly protein PilV
MKRQRLLVLTALVLTSLILTASLLGQVEHAPTVAQCQADQRLWLSQMESDHGQGSLPAYDVIDKWKWEMDDCMSVDPESKVRYYNTESEVWVVQMARTKDFLKRHQMWETFLDEDAAGKR